MSCNAAGVVRLPRTAFLAVGFVLSTYIQLLGVCSYNVTIIIIVRIARQSIYE